MASNNESDTLNERIPGAEPAPLWPEAKEKWQWTWELHYIGLACVYVMLALYSVITVLIFLRREHTTQKIMPYFYIVHSLLVLFGITRASFLLTDPYELSLDYPLVSTRLLFGIGFPCLTSSYSLLHIGFLDVSRARLSQGRLKSKRFVFAVIALHFTVVIVADTTTALKRDTALLLLVCMSFFVFWGFAISFSILYSGVKVLRKCQKQMNTIRSLSRWKNPGGKATQSETDLFAGRYRQNRVRKTARITLLTAVLAMSCCVCNLVALIGVYNVYRGVQVHPEAWRWWSFQTAFRVIEIALAVVMGYAVTPVNFGVVALVRGRTVKSISYFLPRVSRSHAKIESSAYSNNIVDSPKSRGSNEKTMTEPCSTLHDPEDLPRKGPEAEEYMMEGHPHLSTDERISSKETEDEISLPPIQ